MVETHINWGSEFVKYRHPRVDHLFRHIRYYHAFYELDLLEAIRDVLVKKSLMNKAIAVDVGAHTGNHSIFLSKYCKEVHSFEPSKEAAEYFKVNLLGRDNILFHNVALGSYRGVAEFVTPDPSEANVSYIDTTPRMMMENPVEVYPLDYYDIKSDIIKIDIEGGEINCLRGGAETIGKYRPDLFIECRTDVDFRNTWEFLGQWKYEPVKSYAFTPVWHFEVT
jgi:FkbM family methyltransferase